MLSKTNERKLAIKLRNNGLTYGDIQKHVPVAKSTLSLWLRSLKPQHRYVFKNTIRRIQARKKGAEVWSKMCSEKAFSIKSKAYSGLISDGLSKREAFVIGVSLYWAEGSKEKARKSTQFIFSNSDPGMIRFMFNWLTKIVGINSNRILADLYVHENRKDEAWMFKKYWIAVTGIKDDRFGKIYLKKHRVFTHRSNIGDSYRGLVRIRVSRSSDLVRRVEGWTRAISDLGDRPMAGLISLEDAI